MVSLIFASFLATTALALILKQEKHIRLSALIMGILNSGLVGYVLLGAWLAKEAVVVREWFRVDQFSAFIGLLIILLYFLAGLVSQRYIKEEFHEGILTLAKVRLYFALLPLFVLAMLTVVLVDNLGLLWLALETTTLVTTPLVAIYKKDASLEAAWKYIILCSLGISLGLLGVLLISYAGMNSGFESFSSLSIKTLGEMAASLDPAIMQWAFVFVFIGFGTKVGFFPMHTWLPDAHGRTPSPISAMLSGILLNVAFYALVRIKFITDAAIGSEQWTNNLFMYFGLFSVVASAFFLYIQRHYKRMLAYSSVEHMGILAIAVSLGPLGMVPALMHMAAHTLSKSLLFFGSGEILLREKTAKIENVRDLLTKIPITGVLFITGMLALLAVPPFATFASEILILGAAVARGEWLVFSLVLLSLALIGVSLLKHTFLMFSRQDKDEHEKKEIPAMKEKFNITHAVMAVQIFLLVAAGLFMLTQGGFDFFAGIAKSISL